MTHPLPFEIEQRLMREWRAQHWPTIEAWQQAGDVIFAEWPFSAVQPVT